MTKKHFKALAEVVAKIEDYETRRKIGNEIGKVCATYNYAFNWDKWDEACNLEPL